MECASLFSQLNFPPELVAFRLPSLRRRVEEEDDANHDEKSQTIALLRERVF